MKRRLISRIISGACLAIIVTSFVGNSVFAAEYKTASSAGLNTAYYNAEAYAKAQAIASIHVSCAGDSRVVGDKATYEEVSVGNTRSGATQGRVYASIYGLAVAGAGDADGSTWCDGDNSKAILNKLKEILDSTGKGPDGGKFGLFEDFICGRATGGDSGTGIYRAEKSDVKCINNRGKFVWRSQDDINKHMTALLKIAFPEVSRPDSIYTYDSPQWFYKTKGQLTMGQQCADKLVFKDGDGTQSHSFVSGFDATTGEVKYKYAESNGKTSNPFDWKDSSGWTCGDLIKEIKPGSYSANAARNLIQERGAQSCINNNITAIKENLPTEIHNRALIKALEDATALVSADTSYKYGVSGNYTTPDDRINAEAGQNVQGIEDAMSAEEPTTHAVEDDMIAKTTSYFHFKDDDQNKGIECDNVDITARQDVDGSDVTDCYDYAGQTGWVACPVQDKLVETIEGLYEFIEGFLVVEAGLTDPDPAVLQVWTTFQGLANVAFVILFLVVVISQITGMGISNYGLKKMLPKLIIAAVLINLSFIICQLAVDISNIVGSSLVDFMTSIGGAQGTITEQLGKVILTITSVIAVGGIALAAINPGAIIIPVLLFLFSVLLAIGTLFLALFVRQAVVILCIAISPLAFACMVLPNTEPLFKKWFDIFKVMLIMFPVCSMVIGTGLLAYNILAASATSMSGMGLFITSLGAVSVAVFPFFAIPSLIKGSLNGLGTLGAKISGLAQKGSDKAASMRKDSTDKIKANANINRAGLQAKMAGSKFKAIRGAGNLMMSSKGRQAAMDAMTSKATDDTRDANARAFLAGTGPGAAKLYQDKVEGLSLKADSGGVGGMSKLFPKKKAGEALNNYDSKTMRLHEIAKKGAKMTSAEKAEGQALMGSMEGAQIRTALADTPKLEQSVRDSWSSAHMSSPSFAKTKAEDPQLAEALKFNKGNINAAPTASDAVPQSTHNDFSTKGLTDLSEARLKDVMNQTIEAKGKGTAKERTELKKRIDDILATPELASNLDKKKINMLEKYSKKPATKII